MSNYTKSTNFATKDNLTPGDPLKVVRGTEIDTEYNNIATAIATKTDNASAAITGGSITGITDLAVADGGTGASTAAGALNNLLPSQTSAANKYLQSDGTNATWDAVSLSTADITGTLGVANGGTGVTASTGTGSVVLSNSPTLVTPALGTPSGLVGTNISGTAPSLTAGNVTTNANLTGAVTSVGNATSLGSFSSANLLAALTDETGTGSAVFATSPTLVTPALGTPSALVGTNITGTASGLTAGNVTTNANLTGAVTSVGNATSLGSFSSSSLAGALTDETGTGSAVFATSPTLVTPILGTPTSATLTNATGLPIGTGVSGLGTGVATFLATPSSANLLAAVTDETGTGSLVFATSPTLVTPALGTPSSGVVTNLTGTASININGTVGATTASTGAFTSLTASTTLGVTGVATFSAGTAALPALTTTGDTNTGIYFPAADVVATSTGGTERFRIDSSGNLGLGITPSAWGSNFRALQVGYGASINGGNGLYVSLMNTGANYYYDGTNFKYLQSDYASRYEQVSSKHAWYTAPSGTAGNPISFTQALTLDASGNLGLAETSPSAYGGFVTKYAGIGLHANSTSGASGLNLYEGGTGRFSLRTLNGSAGLSFYDSFNGVERARISSDGTFRVKGAGTAGSTDAFQVSGSAPASAASIDSSGNLLVGTTSTFGVGTTIIPSGQVFASRVSDISGVFDRRTDDGKVVSFRRQGNEVGSVSVSTVLTTYNTTSDYRLKTVIGAVTGQGARIDALEPIEYTWTANGSRTRGFLAHKFQEVYADSVSGAKDAVDKDGKPAYQSMQASTSEVIADLVAEIQSLRQRLSAANL